MFLKAKRALSKQATWVLSVAMASCLLTQNNVKADIILISDFDNTITKDRGTDESGRPASWVTYYELHRVSLSAISTVQIPIDSLPKVILVSHQDFDKLEKGLSLGDGHTGSLMSVELRHSISAAGKNLDSIIPGYYQKVGSLTYSRFHGEDYFDPDIDKPTNHLSDDYEAAKNLALAENGSYKGRGWKTMQYFLNSEYGTSGFRLLTMRGFPDQAWDEFFRKLENDGEIQHRPFINPNGGAYSYWALSHPQFANRWGNGSGSKKVGMISDLARIYLKTPAVEITLNPDGSAQEHYHTFIIQEDDPRNMAALLELARDITRRHQHRIKFILLHMGEDEDLRANDFHVSENGLAALARDVVVRADGTLRRALHEEIYPNAETMQKANARLLNSCKRMLSK